MDECVKGFLLGLFLMSILAFAFTQCGHDRNNRVRWRAQANKACHNKYLHFGDGVVTCADGSVYKWREGYIDPVRK